MHSLLLKDNKEKLPGAIIRREAFQFKTQIYNFRKVTAVPGNGNNPIGGVHSFLRTA